jgi:site-specific DNA-methyltransferase (adenine-specific)
MLNDGYIVRGKVIWAKTNPMPHSVGDRLNTTYDVVYHLVRSRSYHFDLDAIRVPHRSERVRSERPVPSRPPGWAGPLSNGNNSGLVRARPDGVPGHELGKNPGDVWSLPVASFRGAHFATFPEGLVERPLLATCPEVICTACGQPWRRSVTVRRIVRSYSRRGSTGPGRDLVRRHKGAWNTVRSVGDLQPCGCGAPTVPGLILDPFFGVGTVALVAERYGRDWLGLELNPEYVAMANDRIDAARQRRAEAPT